MVEGYMRASAGNPLRAQRWRLRHRCRPFLPGTRSCHLHYTAAIVTTAAIVADWLESAQLSSTVQ